MKVLVTGRNGQLAQALLQKTSTHKNQRHEQDDFIFAGHTELDLEKTDLIAPYIQDLAPDMIINTAAWTAVDLAEDVPERAALLNTAAPYEIAKAARAINAKLIHISTDYVYSGQKETPYLESDSTAPQGVYGHTKRAGELRVLETLDKAIILRTAWVYSPFGKNFIKTMLHLAKARDALSVVNDQFGNPTSALDLADTILSIKDQWDTQRIKAQKSIHQDPIQNNKIYHCAGTGHTHWADFARHIFDVSQKEGGPTAIVTGIPTSEWPTKATRPHNSKLDCTALKQAFGVEMPHWKVSVAQTVKDVLRSEMTR